MEPNWLRGPMPFALGMALVEHPAALEKYAALGREDKQRFIDSAATVQGTAAMEAYIQSFLGH